MMVNSIMEFDQVQVNGSQVKILHNLTNMKENTKMIRRMVTENISGLTGHSMKDTLKMI